MQTARHHLVNGLSLLGIAVLIWAASAAVLGAQSPFKPLEALIINTSENPVPIQVTNPAIATPLEPYQCQLTIVTQALTVEANCPQVPIGKRLVVEHVSGATGAPMGRSTPGVGVIASQGVPPAMNVSVSVIGHLIDMP
jgi:hypothetical protein